MIETISSTSTLADRLRERILREGPMTFCEWMKAALYDEREGYYCRASSTPWGREGDYRTSPERSSLFAATFARYFAGLYDKLGGPSEWTIVEAGAGDGRFAYGVLKTLKEFSPLVFSATRYVIDEIGSDARSSSLKRLEQFADRVVFGKLQEIKVNPGIVFSNELLDAFPVHRLTMQGAILREFFVDVRPDGAFAWTLSTPSSERILNHFDKSRIELVDGQVAEVNVEIEDWLTAVSTTITEGYLITVDYGSDAQDLYSPTARMDGTLRSFKRHSITNDVLADPGGQDLTSTVNWTYVKDVAAKLGFETLEFERQDKFLLSAGLLTQLQLESERAVDDAERLRLSTAAREMILPNGMATSFQVLVQKKGL
ncbi:MAG: SAM-dependent methyltransferase [Acidobacteriota bacterium]